MIFFTVFLYYPGLFYEFVEYFDDGWGITKNAAIRSFSLDSIINLFIYDKNDFQYNPLSFLSIAVDYHFWGLNPVAYKAHNLLLHIACGVLMYLFLMTFTRNRFISVVTAFVFLIHPLNIESVTWASARRQSLFFFYLLLSMQLYLQSCMDKHRRWLYFIFAVIAGILSILAKATAIIFPFVFLLIYLVENKRLDRRALSQFIITLPIIIFFIYLSLRQDSLNYLKRDFDYTLFEHLIFAGYSYFFYWYKTIVMYPLAIFYPAPSEHLVYLPFQYYLFFLFTLIVLGLIIFHLIKRQWLHFFALMYYSFAIGSLLNLMFFPLGDLPMLVANRYYYHSGMGILMYFALVASPFYYRYAVKRTYILSTVFVILFLFFSVQLPNWKNIFTLLENTNKHFPSEEMYYRTALEYYYKDYNKEKAFENLDRADAMKTDIWIKNHWTEFLKRAEIYCDKGDKIRMKKDIEFALFLAKEYNYSDEIFNEFIEGQLKCTREILFEKYQSSSFDRDFKLKLENERTK